MGRLRAIALPPAMPGDCRTEVHAKQRRPLMVANALIVAGAIFTLIGLLGLATGLRGRRRKDTEEEASEEAEDEE